MAALDVCCGTTSSNQRLSNQNGCFDLHNLELPDFFSIHTYCFEVNYSHEVMM